jgi:catalase
VVTSLKPSPALSILGNAPGTFKAANSGRWSATADAALLQAVQTAFKQEGAAVVDRPMVGGVEASDGRGLPLTRDRRRSVGGLMPSLCCRTQPVPGGGSTSISSPTPSPTVFIAHSAAAMPPLQAGVMPDAGVVELKAAGDAAAFVKTCGQLRWDRETKVKRV